MGHRPTPDQMITFLQCTVIFLLLTNAISILTALGVIAAARYERMRGIAGTIARGVTHTRSPA